MHSGRPSIGSAFHARVEAFLAEHPELGYHTTGELVKDLLRRWLEANGEARRAAGAEQVPMNEAESFA